MGVMREQPPAERPPLLNLMRVVGLSVGVVSRRTLTVLLAVAEIEQRERTVEKWVQLMLAIEAAEKSAASKADGVYRRTIEPAVASKIRRKSGVRQRVAVTSTPLKQSG